MRRTFFLLIALIACGGSDNPAIDGSIDDGASDVVQGSDATTNDVVTNDVATTDAPTDAVTTDAGADADGGVKTGTPNKVTCGTTVCNTGQVCCSTANLDGGFTLACVGNGQCLTGAARACDEAADCPVNQVCCYEEQANNLSASCRGDCNGGGGTRFQACSSTPECLSGACTVHACTAGGSVETCVGIPNICP